MINEVLHTTPIEGEQPSQFAERVGIMYAKASAQKDKKIKGQFFTPNAISRFMGELATPSQNKAITVLDPGCGTANLSCALIEHLVMKSQLNEITLTLYETDKKVIPYTKQVLAYLKTWCHDKGVKLNNILKEEDFVLKNYESLKEEFTLFGEMYHTDKYDYIISNPPYFKLANDDIHTKACASIVDGQANIYSLFMAICSRLLLDNGQMIFITPRSFASGRYFQSFRNYLFKHVYIDFIHLFNTRKDTFSKDEVLQELVIMRMHPAKNATSITVSFSQGIKDLDKPNKKQYAAKDIVDVVELLRDKYSKERQLHRIPLTIEGNEYYLSPGPHNEVQAAVVEEFAPRFAPGGKLLYIGDTENKDLYVNTSALKALNLPITEHSKLPDIVISDDKRGWLFLIEVVTSHGPVSPKRVVELEEFTKDCPYGIVYVTAFPNAKEFKKYVDDIAWETEVWLSDTPDHMIHFNGDRFIGPR